MDGATVVRMGDGNLGLQGGDCDIQRFVVFRIIPIQRDSEASTEEAIVSMAYSAGPLWAELPPSRRAPASCFRSRSQRGQVRLGTFAGNILNGWISDHPWSLAGTR